MTDVKPGQEWADTYHPGRRIRIDTVTDGKATCTETANPDELQAHLDQTHAHYHPGQPAPAGKWYGDKRGTSTRIAVTTLGRKQWQLIRDTSQ